MTDQDNAQSESNPEIDHEAEFVRVRQRIAGLGDSIRDLNESANELLRSADARTALAVMDPPAEAVEDGLERLESSIAALGRHAANLPDEFDPTPMETSDPEYPGDSSTAFGALPDESAGVEPTTAEQADDSPEAPAFGGLAEPTTAETPSGDENTAPAATEATDSVENSGASGPAGAEGPAEETEDGAQVLEFIPRRGRPQPVEGEEPAFGDLAEKVTDWAPAVDQAEAKRTPVDQLPPPPAEQDLAFGALPQEPASEPTEVIETDAENAADDGLDKIAETESTDVAQQWDTAVQDDAAFDKFFSNEVEPEPAQRWLLNE